MYIWGGEVWVQLLGVKGPALVLFLFYMNVSSGSREEERQESKSEEKVVGFSSASLYPTGK